MTIMAFIGYCLQYMLKINLGIAIVCMVNNTALKLATSHSHINDTLNLYTNKSDMFTNYTYVTNVTVDNEDSKCMVKLSHSSHLVKYLE